MLSSSTSMNTLTLVKHDTDKLYTIEKEDGVRYPGWYTRKDAKKMKKLITDISELHQRQIEPSVVEIEKEVL